MQHITLFSRLDLSLFFLGHCDPCPDGYFKPVSGKHRCSNKSNIT